MKNIISVFALIIAFLFTSVNETQAGRLGTNKSKRGKKDFVQKGFVFRDINGVRFAVVDDGVKYDVYYASQDKVTIQSTVYTKDGMNITFKCNDGKHGFIHISEIKITEDMNKGLIQETTAVEMDKFELRFPTEKE